MRRDAAVLFFLACVLCALAACAGKQPRTDETHVGTLYREGDLAIDAAGFATDAAGNPANGVLRLYRPNGQLHWETQWIDGKLGGTSKRYYESGQLENETPWTDGQPSGLVKSYHPNGKLHYAASHVAGKRQGTARLYDEEGRLRVETPFVQGKEHGMENTYDAHGNMIGQIRYERGRPMLQESSRAEETPRSQAVKSYREHEIVLDRTAWTAADGAGKPLTGVSRHYFPGGGLKEEYSWLNGRRHGTAKTWYADGRPENEIPFVHGKEQGLWRRHHPNGRVMTEAPHVSGKAHGVMKIYDERGVLRGEIPWQRGKEQGLAKMYHASGKLSEERPFLDGQAHGTVNVYDENGALTKQKRYSHGRELPE